MQRTLSAFLAVAALCPLTACSRGDAAGVAAAGTDEAGTLRKREPARVRVRPAERREMVRTLTTTAVVESEQRVAVLPKSSGVLVELHAEEGDHVEAGALLGVLDRRDEEVAVAEARVALQEAREALELVEITRRESEATVEARRLAYEQAVRTYERNEAAGLISAQDLENLALQRDTAQSELEAARIALERNAHEEKSRRTGLERAQLELDRAELLLSYTEIRAPFAGVIADRNVFVGDTLNAGTEAFVLTDLDNLRAVIHRPQRELQLFRRSGRPANGDGGEGEPIEILATTEALPGKEFRGEVQRLSPGIDPASGSFRVTLRLFPAADGTRLVPGMLLRLAIVTDRRPDALVVQKRALKPEGDTRVLFVVRDGRAERVLVREGYDGDEQVEVEPLGGELAAGDLVVVVGNRDLDDGAEVQVVPWESEAPAAEAGGADALPADEPAVAEAGQGAAADDAAPAAADGE